MTSAVFLDSISISLPFNDKQCIIHRNSFGGLPYQCGCHISVTPRRRAREGRAECVLSGCLCKSSHRNASSLLAPLTSWGELARQARREGWWGATSIRTMSRWTIVPSEPGSLFGQGLDPVRSVIIHSFIHLLFEESKYVLNFIQHLYTSRQHIAFKKLYPCCLDGFLN